MFERYWRFTVIDEHICKLSAWPSRLRERKAICTSTGSPPDHRSSIERDKFTRNPDLLFVFEKQSLFRSVALKYVVSDEEDNEVVEAF